MCLADILCVGIRPLYFAAIPEIYCDFWISTL